jgi:hypothetical protein
MERRWSIARIALFAGAAGAGYAVASAIRRRARPKACTQAFTINAPPERVIDFFRASYGDRFVDVREDVAVWNGGGIYVREAPGGRGTEVHMTLHVRALDPKSVVKGAIRDVKAQLEAGEVPTGAYTR